MTTENTISPSVLAMLNSYGCLVFENEHFVYKSGKHGPAYINVDPVLYQPRAVSWIARELAKKLFFSITNQSTGERQLITVIASPAVGAIPLGQEVAIKLDELYACTTWEVKPEVLHVFADKTADGGFALERTGFAAACEGENVLVVEDVLNSGTSATGVIDCVRDAGGTVVGVSCAVSRGGLTATDLDVPHFDAVVNINMVQYLADDCPLCAEKRPIVIDAALGKGQAYQFKHPSYSGGYKTLLV